MDSKTRLYPECLIPCIFRVKIDEGCEAMPFSAISKFMAEGMGYGGEGDGRRMNDLKRFKSVWFIG